MEGPGRRLIFTDIAWQEICRNSQSMIDSIVVQGLPSTREFLANMIAYSGFATSAVTKGGQYVRLH